MQTKQYFREYMEDFNTCTLQHEKFIDLEKWEMAEFNREYGNNSESQYLVRRCRWRAVLWETTDNVRSENAKHCTCGPCALWLVWRLIHFPRDAGREINLTHEAYQESGKLS